MSTRFHDIPERIGMILYEDPHHKEWEFCATCNVYSTARVLKTCSGCAATRRARVYYCSKKCQKKHWPLHKFDCKVRAGLDANEDKGKIPGRWIRTQFPLLNWCIEQIYHYNHMDPCESFICFHIDTWSMRLQKVCITPRSGHGYFVGPRASAPSHLHYFSCQFENHNGDIVYTRMNQFVSNTLSSSENRQEIVGCPHWHVITSQLSREKHLSANVTANKLDLLRNSVMAHSGKSRLQMDIFLAPPVTETQPLEIPQFNLDLWFASISSFDLWEELRDPRSDMCLAFNAKCDNRPRPYMLFSDPADFFPPSRAT